MCATKAEPLRILAIDDENPIFTVLSAILHADGCVVFAANSGKRH